MNEMEGTLHILNSLEKAGIIDRYAIGGAMGAAFYVEPFTTFDLDIFVVLPKTAGGLLTLTPIYDELRRRGYRIEDEFAYIEGTPVQFLPPYNELIEEAAREAVEIDYNGIGTRVMRVEHLIAIALQTGRDKDKDRVRKLKREASVNSDFLEELLNRFSLFKRWRDWIK